MNTVDYNINNEADRVVHGMAKIRLFEEGRKLYQALLNLPQYRGISVVFPTDKQYKDLARSLNLPISYVKKRIEFYLFQ